MPGPQALAALATVIGFVPHGNVVELRLDRGDARVVWVSPSTFRFSRDLGLGIGDQGTAGAPVEVEIEDIPGALVMRSKFLEVAIEKQGVLVRVRKRDGTELMADVASESTWTRQAPVGSRFYGLGPRTDRSL